jgi:hypothetical protein
MSSAKSKAISEINLEEFERRLRAAGAPQAGVEDPLSELTRLVNTIAAERPKSEKVVDIASARMPKTEAFPSAPQVQPSAPVQRQPQVQSEPQIRREAPALARTLPSAPPPPAPAKAPEIIVDETALLRASFDETIAPAVEHGNSDAEALEGEMQDEEAASPPLEYYTAAQVQAGERIPFARPSRRGTWYLKVGGLTAMALLMVGGAVAMKVGGVPGMHKSPPLILAADGPNKVAPPNEATVQSAGDTGALLLKDSAASAPAPVKLVSTEEQPVDLLAQPPAPAPSPKPPAADVQSDPSPKPPAADGQLAPAPNTPIVAPSEGLGGAPASASTLFPSARRVKTVSVRPDGTLISSDTEPDTPVAESPAPAPNPVPAVKPENAGAAALAATPTIDLTAKPAAKSSARVNLAKADAPAPADDANAPLQLGSVAHAAKPEKPRKPKPAVVADATPSAAETNTTPTFETASAGGGWAVQLAAPRSESEAQGAVTRLQNKYGDDLGSTSLAVHKAEVNGETIYRVRAGGLSKAEALTMCKKLKASGGDCFIARNN